MKEDYILQVYAVLKDNLEDEDDFRKMENLIEAMASINAKKAFDMWYPLLSKYENYVTYESVNESYYLTESTLKTLGEALGYTTLDKIILSDRYLYDLLFKRYVYAGSSIDYTQDMIKRALMNSDYLLADQLFIDIYSNGNRRYSWFDIMDSLIRDVEYDEFIPDETAKKLLVKWSCLITNEKERAKILSTFLSTDQDFDLSPFNKVDDKKSVRQNNNVRPNSKNEISSIINGLSCLLNEHPEAISNRQALKAMLSDYFPQNKLTVNMLMMAYDEGLVTEIIESTDIDILTESRMQRVLINNYGITEDLSESIITIWKKSLSQTGGITNES